MDLGFPVSRQNFLTVSVYPLVSARRLQLNAIFLDERGFLVPSTITIPTTTAGTKTETELQCIDGYLLSCTVSDDAGTTLPGEVYCTVGIKVGQVDTNSPIAMLIRGYVYEGNPIYWPGGKDAKSLDEPGRYRRISGVSPGAGNSYDEILVASVAYNFIAVHFTFTSSAVVVSREVYIELVDDSGIVHRSFIGVSVTASQTMLLGFDASSISGSSKNGVYRILALGKTTLFQGPLKAFSINALDMDAGDTITGIRIIREEFAYLPGF